MVSAHNGAMLTTNRDLYLAICELGTTHHACERTLEQYLLTLLRLAKPLADRSSLTLDEFHALLSDSFIAEPQPFDETWRDCCDSRDEDLPGFAGWMSTLIRQIVDLREMDEVGTLLNEHRYGGIDAPRGGRWYNFDPMLYIECAASGSLGGWEPGDDSDRDFVPGLVGVMDASGQIVDANPQDLERPIFQLLDLSWEQCRDFLDCGRHYE